MLIIALFFTIIMRMPDDPVDIDQEAEQVWAPDEDSKNFIIFSVLQCTKHVNGLVWVV